MSARYPAFRVLAAFLPLVGGCQSPATPGRNVAKPNFAQAAPDVRTEATIIQMENQYIADKNDQPTHQHEVKAKAAKKKQEAEAKAAQEMRAAEGAK